MVDDGKAAPLRTIDDASPAGEGGLLGLAVTADEQTVFAYFTSAQDNRIVSMSWDGATLGEPKAILTGIPKGGRHNGGRMVVGPDGNLYVGTGETGDTDLAQDKTSLGGKILRITTDGQPAAGNPFSNEVYSYGHRNVEGLAFDDQGRLWASEFGEQTWDELNLITEGGNYGWPEVEGSGQRSRHDQSEGGLVDRRGITGRAGLLAGLTLDGRAARQPGSGRSRSTARTPAPRWPISPNGTDGSVRSSSRLTATRCSSPTPTPTAEGTRRPATTGCWNSPG